VSFRKSKKIRSIPRYIGFIIDFVKFSRAQKKTVSRFPLLWSSRRPYIHEKKSNLSFDRHYIYHIGWAARILAQTRPKKHIDISSSLAFCTTVSAFIPLEYYEFRPPNLAFDNLAVHSVDLSNLPFADNSIESLSCMHVAEHIGLARYGDAISPDGDIATMHQLARVLAPEGNLLFVVPVGKRQLQFNAHRIYDPEDIINGFPELHLTQFALIPQNGEKEEIIYNPDFSRVRSESYGCGCFLFTKK